MPECAILFHRPVVLYLPNGPKSGSTRLYYSKKQKEISVGVENLFGSLQRIKYYLTYCQLSVWRKSIIIHKKNSEKC